MRSEHRSVFLAEACRGDQNLQRQVESLFAQDSLNSGRQSNLATLAGYSVNTPTERPDLSPGSKLGPYRIEAVLGAGGMGQVFKATDERLSRNVAIKVLLSSQGLAADAAERLIQEARAASALNHPNIVTIHDVGRVQDMPYFVMEFIEGKTLGEVLAAGALAIANLLPIAAQIADVLAAAHARGIVHRDLKPANIMITPESRVKVLDFGLAKHTLAGDDTQNPLTLPGTVLGTCGYMSPEQARGEPTDFRTDLFSFGAVLYEMATGRRAFGGATPAEALASVMRDDPEPISRFNPLAPVPLQWSVDRCLAKDVSARYTSTTDLVEDLTAIVKNVAPKHSTPASTPNNLPAQPITLIGRTDQLAEATQLALQPQVRLLTLTGPGGIGKTRLVVELGRRLLGEFIGGVFFVPLDKINDPELVASEIAKALNLRQAADRPAISLLKDHVRHSCTAATLLLLDNFEHLLSAAPLVTELLSASDHLKIIVTSRAALRLYGEYEFPVPPLAVPNPAAHPEALRQSAAVALFLERATALRTAKPGTPGETTDDEQIRIVAEICARLDGLPLAIELAAARTKVLGLRSLLERMRDPLRLLAGGPRDLPARQQTLRSTLDWSYNLLDPEQQKLFRRLSVFVGGATHEAIEAVCAAKEDIALDLLDAIESLVDNSLLQRAHADAAEPRFVMLETMREYGLARLSEAGEDAYTRRAHAAYCLVLAEEAEVELAGSSRTLWFSRFDAEIGNIRAALDFLAAAGEAQWGMRLATALGLYWLERGLGSEGVDRLHKLLALPAAMGRTSLRARALAWAQDLAQGFGKEWESVHKSREKDGLEALEIFDALQDRRGALRALTHLGVLKRSLGDYEGAKWRFEQAVAVARTFGDPGALPGATTNLADQLKMMGEYEQARQLLAESMHLCEDSGYQLGVAEVLLHQADLMRMQGDLAQARLLCEQSLAHFRALEERSGIAACFHDLALVATDTGDCVAARRLFCDSLKLYWELQSKLDLPRMLEALACCAATESEPERALTLAGCAAKLRQQFVIHIRDAPKAKLERSLETARLQLKGSEATASWMRGWTMPVEEAVQFALGGD